MSTVTTIIQYSFGSPSHSSQRRKRSKRNTNWKRRSKTVAADDMILYTENPKDATRKLLELINEFGKVAGYKINAQKTLFFKKIIYLFILFLAVLGLHFCARAFSSCGKRGPLFIVVRGPLTIMASLVAEHRLQTHRLNSCGSRA